MDMSMGSLMNFLRRDPEYKGKGSSVQESKISEKAKKPDPSKPNVDHESVGAESYEGEDLEKVKSQTLKNVDFAVRQVKDGEVETPIPVVKQPTKESFKGNLYLCNTCAKTFRSDESVCPECHSDSEVEEIVHSQVEGKVPSKDDDDSQRIKKLTEEKDEHGKKVFASLSEALERTNLGYYYSSSRRNEDGSLVYEFTSVGGGPGVEVLVKTSSSQR